MNTRSAQIRDYLLGLYLDTLKGVTEIDPNVLAANRQLLDNIKFENDAVFAIEPLSFLTTNYAIMLTMMRMNYRNVLALMAQALDNEIAVDQMSTEKKQAYRNKTTDDVIRNSKLTMTLGLNSFNDDVYAELMKSCGEGFTQLSKDKTLMRTMFKAQDNLSDDDKLLLCLILSNHVYMLRVFCHNAMFLNKMNNSINAFCKEYSIQR